VSESLGVSPSLNSVANTVMKNDMPDAIIVAIKPQRTNNGMKMKNISCLLKDNLRMRWGNA
jgi:hypothetical protein